MIWKNPHSLARHVRVGDRAGCVEQTGYIRVNFHGVRYREHQLVWVWNRGYLPENDIDHINGVRKDNRLHNLREVSRQCNLRNCGLKASNTSGVKGVAWDSRRNKWVAQMKINYRNRYLGRYEDFSDAVCARLAGEQCVGGSDCYSRSSAHQYVQKHITKKEI